MNVEDLGRNNKIVGGDAFENLKIRITGNNNRIKFCTNSQLGSAEIFVEGNSNRIMFRENTRCGNLRVIIKDNSLIDIGKNTTIEQAYILSRDNCKVSFGKDCMISFQVDFRTSDAHRIYDIESGDLVNAPGDIFLEDHVWIAQGAIVSKNVKIGKNSVIGSRSFVQNVVIPSNCIYAGSPAKLIREGVRWER